MSITCVPGCTTSTEVGQQQRMSLAVSLSVLSFPHLWLSGFPLRRAQFELSLSFECGFQRLQVLLALDCSSLSGAPSATLTGSESQRAMLERTKFSGVPLSRCGCTFGASVTTTQESSLSQRERERELHQWGVCHTNCTSQHLATGCQGSRFVQVFQFAALQVPMQLQVSSVLVSDHGFELFARNLSYGEVLLSLYDSIPFRNLGRLILAETSAKRVTLPLAMALG